MTENLSEPRVSLRPRSSISLNKTIRIGSDSKHAVESVASSENAAREVSAPTIAVVADSAHNKEVKSSPENLFVGRMRRFLTGDFVTRALFVIVLMLLWQGAHWYFVTKTERWSPALFRSPVEVGLWLWNGFGLSYLTHSFQSAPGVKAPQSLWEAVQQASYPSAILASMKRLIYGYGIAVAVGFPLGLLVARFRLADKTIGWMSVSLQSLPSICWVPLAMLWMGRFGEAPILFVTIMGALFATVVAVADGIRQVPPLMARAGRTLGANSARLYFSVLLPSALPGIVTGLKIAWSFAWRSLMAAELIVNLTSLGNLLEIDRSNGDMEGVVATILVIIVIGLATQALLFAPVEKRLRTLWGLNSS